MTRVHDSRARTARIAMALVLLGALSTLGGCFTISRRALMNGQGVSNNSAQSFVYGKHDFTTQRKLYGRLDYLRHGRYQETPYPYFGTW